MADKEEKALSVLEQIKQEREAVEKANEEAKQLVQQLNEAKAIDAMSGKVAQPNPAPAPVVSDEEYAKAALKGEIKK